MKPSHALQRSIERCPGVCPGRLLRFLQACVANHDESRGVRFVARVRKEDFCALYHFRLPDGRPRYAVCCTASGYVITLLEPGGTVWTTRGKFTLGERGLEAAPKATIERNEQ
jgi:hypothetical protein